MRNQASEIGEEYVWLSVNGGDIGGNERRGFDEEIVRSAKTRKEFCWPVRRTVCEIFSEGGEM